MTPRPITGELGAKQQQAIDGPYGPSMESYVCANCNTKYFDLNLYFYGRKSIKCLWCIKFPDRAK